MGSSILAADGSFRYTPANGYTGPDAFSYRASDGDDTSPTRVVSLTIKAVPPSADADACPHAHPGANPDTPEVTMEPTPSPTPSPSPSVEPSTSPSGSLAPRLRRRRRPPPAPRRFPRATEGGVSLPVLLVIVLFVLLLGFGAALYVPKWLEAQRGGPRDLD